MKKKAKILEYLEVVAPLIPVPFYWVGMNNVAFGGNNLFLKGIGISSCDDFIGKTPYDAYPKEIADNIVKHYDEVRQTGEMLFAEEPIVDVTTGETKDFTAFLAPLRDDDGEIIGVIGISIDITAEKKEAKRLREANVFECLEIIAPLLPLPVYWTDMNVILGVNALALKAVGSSSYDDFIGKTAHDIYPEAVADNLMRHNAEVIQTGRILSQEEIITDITTGETKCFTAFKAPLRDSKGNIIGTVGTSIDITSSKRAETLQLEKNKLDMENELHKKLIQEHEKFTKLAAQVAHDIRSPLASLQMVVKSCQHELSEPARVALREAAVSIGDIANNLLGRYSEADAEVIDQTEIRQPVLVSLVLSHLLTDKKYQYQNSPIKFIDNFSQSDSFAFIKIGFVAFKRMLSNLMNNAVEAFDGRPGEVSLKLNLDKTKVQIIIQDNGKGISPEVLEKIRNNVAVTDGKADGNGIGLMQVKETLERNNGDFNIESIVGQGTKITLAFPKVSSPDWIAEEICLHPGDTVVMLDDDVSIHEAWKIRFKDYVSIVNFQHFTVGFEAINFINAVEKDKLLLLADFELLKQELNGIDVIERAQVKRAVLVTSHYNNQLVRDLAAKVNVKILPKQLASEVLIKVIERSEVTTPKQVDMVLIEDEAMLADGIVQLLSFRKKVVDSYRNPQKFLAHVAQYPKDTIIVTDNSFPGQITGIELAKQLHEAGYTQLYLFTGWDLERHEIPEYLTVITKTDTDKLLNLV